MINHNWRAWACGYIARVLARYTRLWYPSPIAKIKANINGNELELKPLTTSFKKIVKECEPLCIVTDRLK